MQLPNALQEEGETISYDFDSGVFTIKVPKECKGQDFEGLDMITSLLCVPKRVKRQPLIEEIEDDERQNVDNASQDDEEDIDWCLEEAQPDEDQGESLTGRKYGFANQKSNIFKHRNEDICLAIDLRDPDTKSRGDRREERLRDEVSRFDEEYYLFCLFEDQDTITRLKHLTDFGLECDQLDDMDLYDMKNLPRRKYLLSSGEKKRLLIGLVDILFAYAYDKRTTEGEETSESNWTISKLSSTLSWLETFDGMRETIISCYRRSLIYPLHRNFGLSRRVMEDVVNIIKKGRKSCVKCLLSIRRLFNQTLDSKFILNDLYITDYCIWIQGVKESHLKKLAFELENEMPKVTKSDLGLDLDLLEKAAALVMHEETERKSTQQQRPDSSEEK